MNTKRRIFRLGRSFAFAVIGLLSAGSIYQAFAEWRDLRLNPPPGDLVDIGGFRLHLNCIGIGGPTVIIEAGSNDFSVGWSDVQSSVAQQTQTCTYDRAGMGWSDYDSEIPVPTRVARNLKTALVNAEVQPPYVLVGHSWGGILIREFAAQFPDEVAGMIFVDSSHENQNVGRPDEIEELPVGFIRYCNAVSFVGITRALRLRDEPWPDYPEIRAMALYRTYSCAASLESRYAASLSTTQNEPPQDLGVLPLRVLTRSVPDNPLDLPEEMAWEETWLGLQSELASLSTNSRHRVVEGASHFIHWDKPDVIVETIHELLVAD